MERVGEGKTEKALSVIGAEEMRGPIKVSHHIHIIPMNYVPTSSVTSWEYITSQQIDIYLLLLRQCLECPHQILPKVLPVLQAHADTQQALVHRGIRHRTPFNQCLHAAQAGSMLEEG